MSEHESPQGDEMHQPKAVKDRSCIFCGKEFTSSSLGRHYDTFIKERNPKAPDGIHNIERIKEMRQGITRRQHRNSMVRRRTSTAANTPGANTPAKQSPTVPETGVSGKHDSDSGYPMSGIANGVSLGGGDASDGIPDTPGLVPTTVGMKNGSRATSKQLQKYHFDQRQKATDINDRARAAELALHELLLSYRASKLNTDLDSNPFDFEPRELDFSALALRCLDPPPTLFSSNVHATPTSWSLHPPGEAQLYALRNFFKEEFRKWKLACKSAMAAFHDDPSYQLTAKVNPPAKDHQEMVFLAEKKAAEQEGSILEHLEAAFTVWKSLEPDRQAELWHLELARAFTARKKENDKLKEHQQKLQQEVTILQGQIGENSHCQSPHEFKIQAPAVIPFQQSTIIKAAELGIHGALAGIQAGDRHTDVNSAVQSSIERWKKAIRSSRAAAQGLSNQRPLEPVTHPSAQTVNTAVSASPSEAIPHSSFAPKSATTSPQKAAKPRSQVLSNVISQITESRHAHTGTLQQPPKPNTAPNRKQAAAVHVTAPAQSKGSNYSASQPSESTKSSIDAASMDIDDSSDQDADGDADMEDDAYIDASQASQQPHSPLEVARAQPLQQAPVQHHQAQPPQPHPGGQNQSRQLHPHHQSQRSSQYIIPSNPMPVGNNPTANNQNLNPGHVRGVPHQMIHGMQAGTTAHMLDMTSQEGVFLN